MPDPERVFLALFAYAGVTPETLDCLLRDLPTLRDPIYHRESKDALISRSRSAAASEFLRSDASILVMIDHDLAWRAGDLSRLVDSARTTRSVVGGVYSKRGFGLGVAVRFREAGDHTLGEDRLVEGEYLSTGFFACHREVVEAMARTLPLTRENFWPLFMPMLSSAEDPFEPPEYLSEDWSFCARARALGFKLYIDLKPQLTHNGTHSYRLIDSQLALPADAPLVLRVPARKPSEGEEAPE